MGTFGCSVSKHLWISLLVLAPQTERHRPNHKVSVWLCSHSEVSVILMQTVPLLWPLSQQVEDLAPLRLGFLLEYNITAARCSNQLLCRQSLLGLLMYRSPFSTPRLYQSHRKYAPRCTARKLYFSVPHYNWNNLYQPRTSHA